MTVLIFPEPGNTKQIAKTLLAMADKASDVEFVLWPQEGFRVPEELALKFEAEFEATTEVEEPVRRKPGRPKKEAR